MRKPSSLRSRTRLPSGRGWGRFTTGLMTRNPYVFVVGCPRSGTTLLQRMLDAHPRLAVAEEMDIGLVGSGGRFHERWRKQVGLTYDGFVTPTFVERLLASQQFTYFGFEPTAVREIAFTPAPVSYPDFVSRLFDLYAEMRGKEFAGDKKPMYTRWISGMHAQWPEARFLHIIRDGRDVYQSMRSWGKASPVPGAAPIEPKALPEDPHGDIRFGEYLMARYKTWHADPVMTVALWWKWTVLLGREDGWLLGPAQYHEIRYEDLVADPVGTSETVCSFLEIPFSIEMVEYADGKTRTDPGLSSMVRWLPPTPGLRDWRTEMSDDAIERFEAAAGDLLDELGYKRGVSQGPVLRAKGLRSVAEMFVQDLRSRRLTVPAGFCGELADRAR